jgi:hypothetical protein
MERDEERKEKGGRRGEKRGGVTTTFSYTMLSIRA